MNLISTLGFIGSLISGYAYVPQIYHLIRERCTAGLSRRAFTLWTVSSILILINAVYIVSPVFIFITSVQTIATIVILYFTVANNNEVCLYHARHVLADPQAATAYMKRHRS